MFQGPTPILHEDGVTLDWQSASYEPQVKVSQDGAMVIHEVRGAEDLETAAARGDARWAIEVRCPSTLYAMVTLSNEREMVASWDTAQVDRELGLFVIPGLLAVRDFQLSADGLVDLWGTEPVGVPAGTWLARGLVNPLKPLIASLIKFRKRDDLPAGCMQVAEPPDHDSITFTAWLAADIYPRRVEREIWHAALIAAFAKLPEVAKRLGDDSDAWVLLDELAQKVGEAAPVWTADDYDPARAASVFEPFLPATDLGEEGMP